MNQKVFNLENYLNFRRKFFEPILKAYSGLLFLPSVRVGLAIFILTLLDTNIGLSGLLAVISAYLAARFLGFSKTFLTLDYYIYNPLLVGLGIGYLFKLSLLSATFIVILSIFTFLLTYTLSNIFGYYLGLSVLSIPFVLVSIVAYLASYKYSKLFVYYLYPHDYSKLFQNLPIWLKGFFSSLGAIIFYPTPLVGALMFLIVLRWSRIAAFLAVLGYFAGTLFLGFMSGNFYASFLDVSAFNYILIAVALGGVFLVPSGRSYLIALAGVLISVPIVEASKVFFQYYGIPIFAIPFNTVVLLFVYTLTLLGYKYRTVYYRGTPEKTLDFFLTFQKRFPYLGREIGLPFSGRWTVWQSFDGEWTHKGAWKYALDFVITDDEGKTYRGDGYYLTDYYAYRKPVLSPVSGTVVEVVDGFPDNPPGQADKENNWGNYVIIQDWRGFYVLLCHFAQNSIKVKKGDKVERGSLLGLCGNSGYSPQPHIHIHVQLLPYAGAPTVPFVIDAYVNKNGKFFDHAVPKKGEVLEAFYADKTLKEKMNLLIDETYRFSVEENGKMREVTLKVEMAPDGTFYLTDGKGKLYFGQKYGVFYSYNIEGESKVLKTLFMLLSKLPLNLNRNLSWKDYIPLEVAVGGWRKAFIRFIASFYHNIAIVRALYSNADNLNVSVKCKYQNLRLEGSLRLSEKGKFVEFAELRSERDRITVRRVD
jgi:urea transporter/murein DD-endopeptidase MepM/ murein hydrolase activator NlpD